MRSLPTLTFWMPTRAGAALFVTLLAACTNRTYLMPDGDENSQAPGQAMVDFSIRKPMPNRPVHHEYEFYFKHCAIAGSQPAFTVNPYECTAPY